jgi:Superinfection immunity protein
MNNASTLILGISMSIYFLPSIIAGFRKHHNAAAILVLNLFLGWTVLGWISALVWSSTFVAPRSNTFVAPHVGSKRDPRWANLRSTTPKPRIDDRSFYVGIATWAGVLLVVGIGIIAG